MITSEAFITRPALAVTAVAPKPLGSAAGSSLSTAHGEGKLTTTWTTLCTDWCSDGRSTEGAIIINL